MKQSDTNSADRRKEPRIKISSTKIEYTVVLKKKGKDIDAILIDLSDGGAQVLIDHAGIGLDNNDIGHDCTFLCTAAHPPVAINRTAEIVRVVNELDRVLVGLQFKEKR